MCVKTYDFYRKYLRKQYIIVSSHLCRTEWDGSFQGIICSTMLSLITGKNHYGLRNSGRVKFWYPTRNEYKLQVGD